MDVKNLRYVIQIAERKNITKAAGDLYISQSSLSQALSKLEQELGVPLFYRVRGELVMTPAGQLYVEAAKKVVEIQKQLYRDIAGLSQRGHITVGVTSNFGMRMISEVVPWFKEKYPGYTVEITELGVPALIEMIQNEQLDLGLTALCDVKQVEAKVELLRREEILLAVSWQNEFSVRPTAAPLHWEEMAEHFRDVSFVLGKQGSTLRDVADRVFQGAGVEPQICCESNNVITLRSMVAHNAAAAFLAESCAIDSEHIAYYHLNPGLYRLNVMVTRKSWNQTQAEQEFCDALRNYFRNNQEYPFLAETV